jgi:hypothetical protein
MPSVRGVPGPYRFFFYSFDCNEPKYVHVRRERMMCKFWLEPVALAANDGFSPVELNRIRVIIARHLEHILEACAKGVNIVGSSEPRISELRVTNESIIAQLADGRTVSVPLAWSWRLSEATPAQRNNFEIMGNGQGVHWPDVDEDISAVGMLCGTPARRPKPVAKTRRRKMVSAAKRAKVPA